MSIFLYQGIRVLGCHGCCSCASAERRWSAGQGGRREAAQLIAGAMHSLDVALVQPGPWQVECRTANHQVAGMISTIDVAPNGAERAAVPAPEQSCTVVITSNCALDVSPSFWILARQVRASHLC